MRISDEIRGHALQLFEPEANTVYSIEAAGHIAQVPRRTILVCLKSLCGLGRNENASGNWCSANRTCNRSRLRVRLQFWRSGYARKRGVPALAPRAIFSVNRCSP
jgi:hypothetical protein